VRSTSVSRNSSSTFALLPRAPKNSRRITCGLLAGSLADQLASGRFIVAAAFASGGRPDEALAAVAVLQAQGAGVFTVQPVRSARTRSDSLDLALHLQAQAGVETIAALTTWDKTIMTLQADLLGAHLEEAYLKGVHLEDAYLSGAHMRDADFSYAHMENADLSSAHLEKANLSHAHAESANLAGAALQRADLYEALLSGCNLEEAHLEGANLCRAHLEMASFSGRHAGAHLESADLSRAHLENACFYKAHLEGACLHRAHFKMTNLIAAHCEGADFSNTRLEEAAMEFAHLGGKTVDPEDLARIRKWVEDFPEQLPSATLKGTFLERNT